MSGREAGSGRLGEHRLLQAERKAVGARTEVPDLAEAAERDERRGVVDLGETGENHRADLEFGRQRGFALLRAFGHRGRPDLDTVADANAQGAGKTHAEDDTPVVEFVETTSIDVFAYRLSGVSRVDSAHLGDARKVAIARKRRAFGIKGGGGDLGKRGELLRKRLRTLDRRGAGDLAVTEGFADAQAMFFAEAVHHRLHDEQRSHAEAYAEDRHRRERREALTGREELAEGEMEEPGQGKGLRPALRARASGTG